MITTEIKAKKESIKIKQPSLTQKVVKGGLWFFSIKLTSRIFGLIRTVILARLLAPEDFGLMGVALVTMSLLYTFSQTGIGAALVQRKGNIEDYLDTAWIVNIFRKIFIFSLLFLGAPIAAKFFNNPQVIPILKVFAFSPLILAFNSPRTIFIQREFQFNKQFIMEVVATIVDISVAVVLAFLLRSVWALVWGLLAGNIARFFSSYILFPYVPKFKFDIHKAKSLLNFGKWIFGSSILVFLITRGDSVLVGKILGLSALGLYQMAYRISNLYATEINHVISRVTFPAYSKLQDNIAKLREAYLEVLQISAFLSFPIAGLIFALAPDFTRLFLGEKWMPMVPAMVVLAWWAVIRSLVGAMSPVFLSIGKPKIVTKLQAIQTVLFLILIYPLTVYGNILGTSLAVFFSALAMFFVRNHILIKTIRCKVYRFYKPILYPMALSIIAIIPIFYLKLFVIKLVDMHYFFLFILVFILFYIILGYIADRCLNYKIQTIMKESFKLLKY